MKLQESPQIYVDAILVDEGVNVTSQRCRTAFYMECDINGTGQLSCRDNYAFYPQDFIEILFSKVLELFKSIVV